MVAPNGARKTKQDHPNLPITIEELVKEAKACFNAGAQALHAHVRDESGAHVLDAGLYTELLGEMARQLPQMPVQITTEAIGKYSAEAQRNVVNAVQPAYVSIAIREMTPGERAADLRRFYMGLRDQGTNLQHIIYAPEELHQLSEFIRHDIISKENSEILIVLGRYQEAQQSDPSDLLPFLEARHTLPDNIPWAVCAFGAQETACLTDAIARGGKARIGFENNMLNADGTLAANNSERVAELVGAIGTAHQRP